MKRVNFNIKDRKLLFGMLTIVLVSIFTLSIAYAALNTVLNISGSAQVSSAEWNVHFDNLAYAGDGEDPEIKSTSTVSFKAVLNRPGDKYFFTVDVVNDGSIDAMIESIEKEPELTAEQAKYLKYELSYANGESVDIKQLVKAGDFVRVKVNLEYRSDISVSDLPSSQVSLNLSIKLNYVQSDDSGEIVENKGLGLFELGETTEELLGTEICLSTECFYLLDAVESDDGTYVDVGLISKYNLYVGNEVSYFDSEVAQNSVFKKLNFSVVRQDSRAVGYNANKLGDGSLEYITPFYGTVPFSKSKYWDDNTDFNVLLNNNDNLLTPYLIEYKNYLNVLGFDVLEVFIPPLEIFLNLDDVLSEDEELIYKLVSTSYWLGTQNNDDRIFAIEKDTGLSMSEYYNETKYGIRPLIVYRLYEY